MTVLSLNNHALGHRLANYWLLLLSIDLFIFIMFQAQEEPIWKSNFHMCFFPAAAMAPHHPHVSTYGIDEKLSKMVSNLVSYSLKSS